MMALTELIFGITRTTVGVVQFDATVSETHVEEAEITDHPVEGGDEVSDNIRSRPRSIQINGRVTNTPIAILASLTAPSPLTSSFLPSLGDRVGDAYAELQRVKNTGTLVDVVTTLEEYSSMAIQSLVTTRDKNTGNVLDCVISLKEVRVTSTLASNLPIPTEAAAAAAANAGTKSTGAASASQSGAGESILSSLLGGL